MGQRRKSKFHLFLFSSLHLLLLTLFSTPSSGSLSLPSQLLDRIIEDETLHLSSQCHQSIKYLRESLDSLEDAEWPVQMANSLLSLAPDFRAGRKLANFGEYDTCLSINTDVNTATSAATTSTSSPPSPGKNGSGEKAGIGQGEEDKSASKKWKSGEHFIGQFCLYRQHYNLSDPSVVKMFSCKPRNYERFLGKTETVSGSVCLPSTCNLQDVHALISKHLAAPGTSIELRDGCETSQSYGEDSSHIPWLIFLLSWVAFILCVSFFIETTAHSSWLMEVLSCFSIQQNTFNLTQDNSTEFKFLYGFRFFFLVVATGIHVFLLPIQWAPQALINILNFNGTKSLVTLAFGTHWSTGMGANFVWAAFLGFFSRLKCCKHFALSDLIFMIIARFLRTIPPVLGCYLLILAFPRHLGSGPVWNVSFNGIKGNCYKSAWTEVTYMQNMIYPEDTCVMPSWFIAPDMQFFVASFFIICFYCKRPLIAKIAILFGVIASMILQWFYLTYNEYPGVLDASNYDYSMMSKYAGLHIDTVNYISSYLLGLLSAIVCYEGWQVTRRVHRSITVFTFTTLFLSIFAWAATWRGRSLGRIEELIFGSIYRTTISLFVSATVWLCYITPSNFFVKFLSLKFFSVLGRFNFSIYLAHFIFVYYDIFTTSSPIEYSLYQFINRTIYVMVDGIVLGFIVHLFFEAPFIRLAKIIVRELKAKFLIADGKVAHRSSPVIKCKLDLNSNSPEFSKLQ